MRPESCMSTGVRELDASYAVQGLTRQAFEVMKDVWMHNRFFEGIDDWAVVTDSFDRVSFDDICHVESWWSGCDRRDPATNACFDSASFFDHSAEQQNIHQVLKHTIQAHLWSVKNLRLLGGFEGLAAEMHRRTGKGVQSYMEALGRGWMKPAPDVDDPTYRFISVVGLNADRLERIEGKPLMESLAGHEPHFSRVIDAARLFAQADQGIVTELVRSRQSADGSVVPVVNGDVFKGYALIDENGIGRETIDEKAIEVQIRQKLDEADAVVRSLISADGMALREDVQLSADQRLLLAELARLIAFLQKNVGVLFNPCRDQEGLVRNDSGQCVPCEAPGSIANELHDACIYTAESCKALGQMAMLDESACVPCDPGIFDPLSMQCVYTPESCAAAKMGHDESTQECVRCEDVDLVFSRSAKTCVAPKSSSPSRGGSRGAKKKRSSAPPPAQQEAINPFE